MKAVARAAYRAIPFKRQAFELIRRGPRLPRSVYQHMSFEGPFTVAVDDGHRFRVLGFNAYVENELFWAGFGRGSEGYSLRVWAEICRSRPGLIIDIGANTGVYALSGSAVSEGGDVIAFEPLARIAERLSANIALNELPIVVERKAVSDRTGTLPIYDTMQTHNYSASLEGQGPAAQSYEVEVCALDDYLEEIGNPAIAAIKIDVERHEPAVLRGMKRSMSMRLPPILIEILDEEIGSHVAEEIEGLGYDVYRIDEELGLIPTRDLMRSARGNRNYLFCTQKDFERAGLVRFRAD